MQSTNVTTLYQCSELRQVGHTAPRRQAGADVGLWAATLGYDDLDADRRKALPKSVSELTASRRISSPAIGRWGGLGINLLFERDRTDVRSCFETRTPPWYPGATLRALPAVLRCGISRTWRLRWRSDAETRGGMHVRWLSVRDITALWVGAARPARCARDAQRAIHADALLPPAGVALNHLHTRALVDIPQTHTGAWPSSSVSGGSSSRLMAYHTACAVHPPARPSVAQHN